MYFLTSLILMTNISHAEDLEHLRSFHWETRIPNVVICNGADISMQLVSEAVDFWRLRGEKIGSVTKRHCDDRPLRGEIGIYVSNDMVYPDSFGETINNTFQTLTPSGKIDINHSRIYIRPQYTDSYILIEHELGHALGFDDTDEHNSIMSKRGDIY